MASKISRGHGEQVTCPNCWEHFSDPRVLPCLHTYCRRCLEDLVTKGTRKASLVCPECRETVQVTSSEYVSQLEVNFLVNNPVSLLAMHSTEDKQTKFICENCDSQELAQGRCFDCRTFLCKFCLSAHKRFVFVTPKHHRLMTLEEIKEKKLFCGKHNGEVRGLFCETCQELICRDCIIIDHREHEFKFIVDVVEKHKNNLKRKIKTASKTKKKVDTALSSVQEMKEKVEMKQIVLDKEIDDFVDRQIKALEEKRNSLKEKARTITATKIKKLAAQEDGLSMHLAGLKSAIEFTETVLARGGNSGVLSMSRQATARLTQLYEKPFSRFSCVSSDRMMLKIDEERSRNGIVNFIANVIDGSVPDIEQCTVSVRELNLMIKIGEFDVRIKNCFGDNLQFMEDRIAATTDTGDTLKVKGCQDGTYRFILENNMWCPMPAQIFLLFDGSNVKGSPIDLEKSAIQYAFDQLEQSLS